MAWPTRLCWCRARRYGDGLGPSTVIATVTSSYDAFTKTGLFAHASDSLVWLGKLPECQQLVLQFIGGLLSGSPAIQEVLEKEVKAEYLVPAETVLHRAAWLDLNLLDMKQLATMHEAALKKPEPAAQAPCGLPPKGAAGGGEPQTPEKKEADAIADAQRYMPDVEQPVVQEERKPVESYFPALALTDMQKDVLRRVPEEKLQNIMEHAQVRCRQFISITVGPPYVLDADVLEAKETRLFIWDVKAHMTNASAKAHFHPWSLSPPFDAAVLKKSMKALFGKDDGLFRKNDVAMFLDGRVPSVLSTVSTTLKKSLKDVSKELLPTRNFFSCSFFYHNREFTSGFAKPRSLRGNAFHALLPSHLETGLCVVGKAAEVPLKERRWLDLPGSNRSRGWSQNAIAADHILVPWGIKTQLPQVGVAEHMDMVDGEAEAEKDEKGIEEDAATICYPWSSEELFWRELWNSMPDGLIIMSSTPSPFAALAAARLRRRYLGWVSMSVEKDIFLQSSLACVSEAMRWGQGVHLRVCVEMLLGNREDGV